MSQAQPSSPSFDSAADAVVDPEALAALVARCHREVDDGVLPSAQVAVAKDSQIVAFETFGDAAPDSRYVIFSATKPFVASALWLLLGAGAVSIDQRVAEVIPEFGTNGKEVITIKQLLLHEGGFPQAPLGHPMWADRALRLEQFGRWRLNWEPGTAFEYHPTAAHWVIAELIERLSGVEYREFIQQRVLDALGLKKFRLGVPLDEQGDINLLEVCGEPPTNAELEQLLGIPGITLESLQGEVTEAVLVAFNTPDVRTVGVPGGGGVSTAADVALFYQALMHNPGGLWDPAVLASGTREVYGRFPDPTWHVPSNRALGTVIAGEQPDAALRGFGHTVSPRAFGHAGAGGQLAFADPDSGVSFCYLTNGLDANMIRMGRRGSSIANYVGRLVHGAGVGAGAPESESA
jgi:CubicO group peptidase (beta-lactamase class C family)